MPFLVVLFQKVCKSVIAHRTPKNEPHARTSHTLFRMDFAHTRTRATAHRTCACAHAPSQLIPWYFLNKSNKISYISALKVFVWCYLVCSGRKISLLRSHLVLPIRNIYRYSSCILRLMALEFFMNRNSDRNKWQRNSSSSWIRI